MNSEHTFKTASLPTEQPVESNNFEAPTGELPSRFQSLKVRALAKYELCSPALKDIKNLFVCINDAVLQTANRLDAQRNPFDFVTTSKEALTDTITDDPIAQQKLAGSH